MESVTMAAQTQLIKQSPIKRIQTLVKDYQWEECKTQVKQTYQTIKPYLDASRQSDVLVWVYNKINETQICNFTITELFQYMNSKTA